MLVIEELPDVEGKCNCSWCKLHRKYDELVPQMTPEVKEFLDHIYEDLVGTSDDRDYYRLRSYACHNLHHNLPEDWWDHAYKPKSLGGSSVG